MNEDGSWTARSDEYTYWRRYLDEDVWETVGVDTARWALADVYHDMPLALDFLHEAGVTLGARHGADAVVVRLPIHHRAVGQPDTEARSTEMQVFAGHRQLAARHGFPALVGRRAVHERLGPVVG